jgi:hypothetical protein
MVSPYTLIEVYAPKHEDGQFQAAFWDGNGCWCMYLSEEQLQEEWPDWRKYLSGSKITRIDIEI